MPTPCGLHAGPRHPRKVVCPSPLNNTQVTSTCSFSANLRVPGTTVCDSPLDNGQVPVCGSIYARFLAPRATILTSPLDRSQVPSSCSSSARPAVPWAVLLSSTLQKLGLDMRRQGHAQLGSVARETALEAMHQLRHRRVSSGTFGDLWSFPPRFPPGSTRRCEENKLSRSYEVQHQSHDVQVAHG